MLKTYVQTQRNFEYHRRFAQSLLKTLGYEGAVQACHENQWHGVLSALEKEKRFYR